MAPCNCISSRREPVVLPIVSHRHFHTWATTLGVPLDPMHLPWLQPGPIPWKTYPFLGTACKAFSLLRKLAPVVLPPQVLVGRLSPWHSCLFRNTNANTYYSPRLIRIGATTMAQLTALGESMEFLPPTWPPFYKDAAPRLLPPLPTHSAPPPPPRIGSGVSGASREPPMGAAASEGV